VPFLRIGHQITKPISPYRKRSINTGSSWPLGCCCPDQTPPNKLEKLEDAAAMKRRLLLVDERGTKHLVREGDRLETDIGIFNLPRRASPGTVLRSHLGRTAFVLEPSIRDYVERMPRPTSIPYFEDIGFVLAFAGLRKGQTVVEAGTGSGACALYFSQAVGPAGKVHSFEIRADIHRIAVGNVQGFGCRNVELVCDDVRNKPRDLRADLFFLDLASPSRYVDLANGSMKPGGMICAFAPFVEEGARCVRKLKALGCFEVRMLEVPHRDYEVSSHGTRPKTTQTVHTGYLAFARALPLRQGRAD